MITALKLLREAAALGWTFKVDGGGDEPDYVGASAAAAWEAVKATDEAWVSFRDAQGNKLGRAHLMAPGPMTCSDDETLVDHTCPGNEFEELCDRLIEEAV